MPYQFRAKSGAFHDFTGIYEITRVLLRKGYDFGSKNNFNTVLRLLKHCYTFLSVAACRLELAKATDL